MAILREIEKIEVLENGKHCTSRVYDITQWIKLEHSYQ